MDHKPWETLSSEVINKNPWTKFIHDEYVLPNGKKGDYYYIKTPVGSVTIIPVLPSGKIVLNRQFRYLFQKPSLSFPAGGIKEGKTANEAAQMELQEETGYTAAHWKHVGDVAPSIGLLKELMSSYIAWDLTPGEANPDESEEFEVVEMSIEEIDAAISSGEIWDAFAVSAWCLARSQVTELVKKI
jgi:ADP-ribose pyrophosphatase